MSARRVSIHKAHKRPVRNKRDIDSNRHLAENHVIKQLKHLKVEYWTTLYESSYDALCKFFQKKFCDQSENFTEECIQETFSRAYVDIQLFEGKCDIETWILNIAHHVAQDIGRSITPERHPATISSPRDHRHMQTSLA